MIPLKLHIRNFLSYGPDTQEINFEPYNLICLSGKNGHGKSALLDAFTWVLWGQARKMSSVAKADDSLLRLGQHHMVVALTFVCNGQQYRVRREYNKIYGKPISVFEVGLYDSAQDRFVPLGGKSIRESQALVDDILRLDFDSFCNSAFLRQGQSNEFSKKSPKERKDILSNILGLNEYEKIRKIASEKGRERANELATLQVLQEKCAAELQSAQSVSEALGQMQEKLQQLAGQERELADVHEVIKKEQAAYHEVRRQHAEMVFCVEQLEQQEAALRGTVRQKIAEWRAIYTRYVQAGDVAALEREKKEVLAHVHQCQQTLAVHLSIKERADQAVAQLHTVEQQFVAAHTQRVQNERLELSRLTLELEHVRTQSAGIGAQLATTKNDLSACQIRFDGARRAIADVAATEVTYARVQAQFEKRKLFYQRASADGNTLKRELDALVYKKQMATRENVATCPLCEQVLSVEKRSLLQGKWSADEQFMRHRLARLTRVLPKLKDLLVVQHQEMQELERCLKECARQSLQCVEEEKRGASLCAAIKALEKGVQESCDVEKALTEKVTVIQQCVGDSDASNEVWQRVRGESAYQAARVCVATCQDELRACGYDASAHEQAMKRLSEIENACSAHREVLSLYATRDARKSEIAQLYEQMRVLGQQKKGYQEKMRQFCPLGRVQEGIEQKTACLDAQRAALARAKEALLQEKGALEHRHEYLMRLGQEYAEQQKKVAVLQDQIDDLQAIIAATGKDGIQALLIQEVLPEIESEANSLLSRLTENQAQIFIESVRDLKKGGTKETLDINISDSVGIRSYELFSGGEAFRIDFALRIALSKLLARRAGTSLQTLIIDEGFGSQDEEGLSRIMDALYKIQDDFAKVIVVSHLPAMKDQFPVQFVVEKKPSGSVVTVIEQG